MGLGSFPKSGTLQPPAPSTTNWSADKEYAMIPSSSGEQEATYIIDFEKYTNIPNYILTYLFEQKRGDLGRTALKLYLYLRSKKNNTSGFAWPGVRTIVREAHVSKDDVKPARDQLVTVGLISISPVKGPRGTVLIDFNDEQIAQTMSERPPIRGTASVPPLEGQGVPPIGEHTNTNTITTLHNTKGKGKKKEKKSVRSPRPKSVSPGVKTNTKRASLHRGNTTHLLLKQKRRPTYEDYLKHSGNQWEWGAFILQWEQSHSK